MKKRHLILACGLILLCGLVLGACKSHDESIDENLLGQWGGEHGPVYHFFREGRYERYSGTAISGKYTTKSNKLTIEPSIKYRDVHGDKLVFTYSIEGDTLTLSSKGGGTYSYTRMKPIVP